MAEAWRGHGFAVWFDQDELRGGDSWDQKLRRQIKACARFVPGVSAATPERREGYFRLEWKLAAERTHLMAEGVPFFAPVVVDGTKEANALVPADFMKVQWTRLAVSDLARAFQPVSLPNPDTGWKARATPMVGRRVPAAAWGLVLPVCWSSR